MCTGRCSRAQCRALCYERLASMPFFWEAVHPLILINYLVVSVLPWHEKICAILAIYILLNENTLTKSSSMQDRLNSLRINYLHWCFFMEFHCIPIVLFLSIFVSLGFGVLLHNIVSSLWTRNNAYLCDYTFYSDLLTWLISCSFFMEYWR